MIGWQRRHGRHDLPWQNTSDPYRVWLSEIMLQQTQVATVLPYFTRFAAEFPDVATLAAAPLARVLELWSGLGYYRRAHHLHAAARIVVERHGGRFPADAATLATLPGIGRSTAAAIAALACGTRAAILDGNVKRVLARHRGIEGWPGEARVQARLWQIAEGLLPPRARAPSRSEAQRPVRDIGAYTQGMMDLGATICTRARPRCAACPVARDCVARCADRVASLPAPRPRKRLPQRAATVLLLERGGEFLLEQRPPLGVWAGLWSFPETESGADVAAYVAARFDATIEEPMALAPLRHAFTHFALTLHPVRAAVRAWPARVESPCMRWLTPAAAIDAAVPAPVRTLLRSLVR